MKLLVTALIYVLLPFRQNISASELIQLAMFVVSDNGRAAELPKVRAANSRESMAGLEVPVSLLVRVTVEFSFNLVLILGLKKCASSTLYFHHRVFFLSHFKT